MSLVVNNKFINLLKLDDFVVNQLKTKFSSELGREEPYFKVCLNYPKFVLIQNVDWKF